MPPELPAAEVSQSKLGPGGRDALQSQTNGLKQRGFVDLDQLDQQIDQLAHETDWLLQTYEVSESLSDTPDAFSDSDSKLNELRSHITQLERELWVRP